LAGLEEAPWGEWRDGRGFNARALAGLLKPYGIRSRDVRVGDKANKGYRRDQFEEAWDRYLPAHPPGKTRQRDIRVNTGDSGISDPRQDSLCPGSENGENPRNDWDVADVANEDVTAAGSDAFGDPGDGGDWAVPAGAIEVAEVVPYPDAYAFGVSGGEHPACRRATDDRRAARGRDRAGTSSDLGEGDPFIDAVLDRFGGDA
jgi:hypothetical protein